MKKTRRKFLLYAVLAVFASLFVLLGIINMLVFTTAAEDADAVTQMIATGKGTINNMNGSGSGETNKNGGIAAEEQGYMGMNGDRFGPMGPESPEISNSLRYFTVAFEKDSDVGTIVTYNISAVTEEEAIEWATALKSESTGWTKGTYRYRVYKQNKVTYVTVIDQGRELLPAYRILIYSIVGTIAGTLISFAILLTVSNKLFAPLEDADRKQRKFIVAAEREFKLPLTVINADTEIIEREGGPTEQTRSIHRQVNKMTSLVDDLATLAVFEEESDSKREELSLNEMLETALENNKQNFAQAGIEITKEIEIAKFKGEKEAFERVFAELIENVLKYAETKAKFTLMETNGRIRIGIENDTDLPDGDVNQVFDRFVTLDNVVAGSAGLGLAYVKEVIDKHNGRENAKVEDKTFVLNIDL